MKNGTWQNVRLIVPHAVQTLDDAMKKYGETETVKKKGEKRELVRIAKWREHTIAKLPVGQVTSQHLAEHRDARRKDGTS